MIYIYQHPETGQVVEVSQGMNDVHEYYEDDIKWNRVYTIPNASIDTKIDPFSAQAFADKTAKKGTMGDIFDRSKEMSEMRKDKLGYDPVLQKEVKDYRKKFKVPHPSEIKKL